MFGTSTLRVPFSWVQCPKTTLHLLPPHFGALLLFLLVGLCLRAASLVHCNGFIVTFIEVVVVIFRVRVVFELLGF